jgi:hypothetical protein
MWRLSCMSSNCSASSVSSCSCQEQNSLPARRDSSLITLPEATLDLVANRLSRSPVLSLKLELSYRLPQPTRSRRMTHIVC